MGEGTRAAAGLAGHLAQALESVLDEAGHRFLAEAREEVIRGVSASRLGALMGRAGRAARGAELDLGQDERSAWRGPEGWRIERWSAIDALRAVLLLELRGVETETGAELVEEAFRYADEGELVSLYRALFLLPAPERFAWRAKEGARTNMKTVFEALVCDGPYPCLYFDEVAWKQALLKCLFVGASLSSVHGVDERLSEDLARMALDYADERRSAGRSVPPELWVLLGPHAGERGLASLEQELSQGPPSGRFGAMLALARGGEGARLEAALASEADRSVQEAVREVLASEPRPTTAAFGRAGLLVS